MDENLGLRLWVLFLSVGCVFSFLSHSRYIERSRKP
nr:MAG TPA: hypothetical protein [Caudoviricetes sp.]DAV48971.1 MAG TPA: hypothetical protein [Caudoviricetes sp.]